MYDNLNLVSIVVITYQHEKYIKQCLDSILMQITDFDIEIIIGDDCSLDKTAEIIGEYHRKLPHIIKPTLRSVNVGTTKNQYDCFLNCKGEYIAILDGDDFWTNKEKLKNQVNFLKKNKDYIACTQRYSVVDQDNNVIQETYIGPGRPESGDYTITNFTNYIYYGHPGTLVFRNIFVEPQYDYNIITKADRFICDITLCLILTCLGKIHVSNDNMTSYRSFQVKGGANWTSTIAKKNQMLDRINFLNILELYCQQEFKREIKHEDRLPYYVWWSILYILRYPSSYNWKCLKDIYSLANDKKKVFLYILQQVPKLPAIIINYLKKIYKNNQLRRNNT